MVTMKRMWQTIGRLRWDLPPSAHSSVGSFLCGFSSGSFPSFVSLASNLRPAVVGSLQFVRICGDKVQQQTSSHKTSSKQATSVLASSHTAVVVVDVATFLRKTRSTIFLSPQINKGILQSLHERESLARRACAPAEHGGRDRKFPLFWEEVPRSLVHDHDIIVGNRAVFLVWLH